MRPATTRKLLGIGSGFFAVTLAWSVYNAYMPLLLGNFIDSRALRGAIMGIDNLMALLLIPLVGAWSDRVVSPLGSRLPFIVIALPAAGLLLAMLPLASGSLVTLILVDLVFLLAMTVLRAPIIALMPDHVSPEQRSAANGLINLMGGLGGLVAFLVLAPLWDLGRIWPFLLGGVLLFVVLPLLWRVIDRKPPHAEPLEGEETTPLGSLLAGARQLFLPAQRQALRILTAIAVYTIGFAAVEAQFTVYATERLGLSGGLAGLLLGAFSLAFVLAAVPAGALGVRLGKASAMRYGLLVMPAGLLAAAFSGSVIPLGVSLVVAGIGWALVTVQAYPWVADLGGRNRIGFFTGMYYLFTMSAAVIAPALAGLLMDAFGDSSLFILAILALIVGFVLLPRSEKAVAARA
jgi:MFS family permease